MKNLILLIVLFPILVIGQSQNENYIKNTTYKVPTSDGVTANDGSGAVTDSKKTQNITYIDGLGRPIQLIAYAQGGNGKDVVTHMEYDEFGRQTKEYLPYASTNTPSLDIRSNALTELLNYPSYLNQNPFSEKAYDNSPLNRVIEQGAPGNNWALNSNHTIKYDYDTNSSGDQVVNFQVSSTFNNTNKIYDNTLICNGYYNPYILYKSVTKDENWTSGNNNTTQEFKDQLGRVVLKRNFENNIKHDTYYVYDKLGQLAYVIPPLASESIVQVQSNQVPYTYQKSFPINEFLLDNANNPVTAGGGSMIVSIQNSSISINFSCSWSGEAHFDTNKEFEIDAIQPLPNMTLGYVDIYYGGNHKYIAKIIDNKLIFEDITPNDPPFPFTSIMGQNINHSLDTNIFGTTYAYSYTINYNLIEGLCYQYKYDYRNRMVEKKLPGKQWEFIIYDKLDRVVATGPALSPFTDAPINTYGWLVTKYDAFNRVVYTGWQSETGTFNTALRSSKQGTISGLTAVNENKVASNSVDGVNIRYSNSVNLFATAFKLLSVNYYDDYDYPNAPTIPTTVETQPVFYNATVKPKGLQTGTWVRIVETSLSTIRWDRSYVLYDYKARPIRNYTTNYLGGFTQVDTKYDFTKTLHTVSTHRRTSTETLVTVKDAFTYTAQDRVLTHTHQINGGTIQLLAKNDYDELGQLVSKRVGHTDVTGATALQKVDYTYNIRGWLTGINKVDGVTNPLQQGTDPLDLFGFKINYDSVQGGVAGVDPLYNGNIAETYWRTSSDNTLRKYGYQYDDLNRLTNSIYQKPELTTQVTNSYNESLSYDKNGNITSLQRFGDLDTELQTIEIDNLAYTYDTTNNPNQLLKVFDSSNHPEGFKDDSVNGVDSSLDYGYDANGNMTSDQNKGITSISYNHLNLPVKIVFNGDNNTRIEYLYTATGQKVLKKVSQYNCPTCVAGTNTVYTDYLSGYQYTQLNTGTVRLDFFPHAEGYVNNTVVSNNNVYSYVFNYTDHLGNIRLSYTRNSNGTLKIMEENHYYPFGLKHKKYNTDEWQFIPSGTSGYNSGVTTAKVTVRGIYQYKFGNKELQDELGLNVYDYGARNYDPAIGRWMNIDPLAELYPNKTPYHFVSNNPINRVDPRGLTDYQVNGETRTINDGHDNVIMKVSERQYKRLQNKFDKGGSSYERMMNRLSDKNGFITRSLYADSSSSSGFAISLTQHKAGSGTYGQWSIGENHKTYGTVEHIARVADSGLGAVTGQFRNINLGSNGRMYYRQNSGAIFRGNQYVNVTSAATKYRGLAKGAKIGGLVTGVALGGYEIYQGYQQDGGHYGYNSQVQTGGAVGGLAGGYIGAEAGAYAGALIGSAFGGIGAVPGAIIGGLIGGAFCAWGGDFYGEQAVKAVIE